MTFDWLKTIFKTW